MSNPDSQRSEAVQKRRRKFHSALCSCSYCVSFYENKSSVISPYWQCFCSECTEISTQEMKSALEKSDISGGRHLINVCTCVCGVCKICLGNLEFFFTVMMHKQSDEKCGCPLCSSYDCTNRESF